MTCAETVGEAGRLVRDEATLRVGVLMYIGPWRDPGTRRAYDVAFLRPEGGGCEWLTGPGAVVPLPVSEEAE